MALTYCCGGKSTPRSLNARMASLLAWKSQDRNWFVYIFLSFFLFLIPVGLFISVTLHLLVLSYHPSDLITGSTCLHPLCSMDTADFIFVYKPVFSHDKITR